MNKEKKQKLADKDPRWEFEKKVQVPNISGELDWETVKNLFNSLQENQGDLYMAIDKLDAPSRIEKAKLWNRNRKENGSTVTFHNSRVYNFYRDLANELSSSVGHAVFKLMTDKESLRNRFDLGKTVNVNVSDVGNMDTSKSKVSKEELKEMIKDEKSGAVEDNDVEGKTLKDNDIPDYEEEDDGSD